MADNSEVLASFLWSVADLLRSEFKQSDYGKVILPFTVLRRLDCLLEATKKDVVEAVDRSGGGDFPSHEVLMHLSGQPFYNTSPVYLQQALDDPSRTAYLLRRYLHGFSSNAREVLERYEFDRMITRLDEAGLLYMVVSKFLVLDLGRTITERQMGSVFEELVRRYAELSNETAGEHFTPRDVVRLMVDLVISPDADLLTIAGAHRTVFDPVCGTGGLLSGAAERIEELNPHAAVTLYGQDINPESWAICRSDMMMKGRSPDTIALRDIFQGDRHEDGRFDYLLASPPFGVDWKRSSRFVQHEHAHLGFSGRFGAGLPRINDGSLLFLQHMLAKMKPVGDQEADGSRLAIVFNRSPMHSGMAGSGESNIREWIVKNDWLEAVIALPEQLFYNTGIPVYLWILTNRKAAERRGKVVLINAQEAAQKMRRSIGDKRRYIAPDQAAEIVRQYRTALEIARDPQHPESAKVKVLENEEFLYRRIVIDRPLRLRYELTEESLAQLSDSRVFRNIDDPDGLLDALRSLVGSVWKTRAKAFGTLRSVAKEKGHVWPKGVAFEKAVRKALGVRDVEGEVQKDKGKVEADPEQRSFVELSLKEDLEEYLRREVLPDVPDAWIDHTKTRNGCEVSPAHFFVPEVDGPHAFLRQYVRVETTRMTQYVGDEDAGMPYLRVQDLHVVDSAVELPSVSETGLVMTPCGGGDLVGRPGNWRHLPQSFGEAATTMFVLHPLPGRGRTLCEWLNSRKDNAQFPSTRDLMNLRVPIDLVEDEEIDGLLEDVQDGRRKLRSATSEILPNVFAGKEADLARLKSEIRSSAYEARLVGDLVRPLEDPIWRAEWSYPFHLSALARRYRISTHPAERKDGLLKLGEGIARVLGILALAEIVALEGFTSALRRRFRTGATFGTWLTLIEKFVNEIDSPRLAELASLNEVEGTRSLLDAVKTSRNDTHHAHGVRSHHELNEDVENLEPLVVSAISSVNWLSGTPWEWVDRCEYIDDSFYRVIGSRLRGSHPSWEPFERVSTYPLRPNRIYVDSTVGTPVDLWPLATVSLCPECRVRELFLLNQCQNDTITLRSLEEHELEIPYSGSD
ncbi:class I SAM-dependent DNA methyltransferase [Streptosporangium sp. NPDC051022]|uniref:type I restriction-modification system subunit M n=1 Tax=Streptosporangium sp. NPDC051022 TaxID=3155752 RepID=UPI0034155E7E